MPELPEVETIARGLTSRILGQTIQSVEVSGVPMFRMAPGLFRESLEGRRVEKIYRHGKSLFLELKSATAPARTAIFWNVHLGMSGQIVLETSAAPRVKHTHLVVRFKNKDEELRYVDIRRFGKMKILDALPTFPVPDAWLSTDEVLYSALRQRKGFIKHTLLNQKTMAGLGNIYVDEALFKAGIHPLANVARLSNEKLKTLTAEIRAVLKRSIDVGGTSFRNYVDINGGRGGFKRRLFVYGKDGENCSTCGSLIKKMVAAGRGTHFCPTCQRKTRG